jgi:hypothetical protein
MADLTFTCPLCNRTWPYDAVDKVPSLKHRKCICGECYSPKAFNHFGGATYDPALDEERLCAQQQAVNALMADGAWRTPLDIQARVKGSESALTARLRDIRKPFGKAAVDRRRKPGAESSGINEYRVTIPAEWLLRWGSKRRAA